MMWSSLERFKFTYPYQFFIRIVFNKPVRPRLLVERPYYVQQLVDDDEVDAAGGAKVDGQVPAGPN